MSLEIGELVKLKYSQFHIDRIYGKGELVLVKKIHKAKNDKPSKIEVVLMKNSNINLFLYDFDLEKVS